MMENLDGLHVNTLEEKQPPMRRVGTLTLGVVLVVSGIAMVICLLFPRADLRWVLKASPLILISLGIETLFAASHHCRIKYDWVAMLLSFLIVCTALVLFVLAWFLLYHPAMLPVYFSS